MRTRERTVAESLALGSERPRLESSSCYERLGACGGCLGHPPACLLSCERGCHVDFRGSLLPEPGGGCRCCDGHPVSPPTLPNLSCPHLSASYFLPPRPHTTEEGGWDGEACTGPAWPGQAEGQDQGPPRAKARRLVSPLRPAGPCILLPPRARMTDGPPRKGHCLRSSCVFGGGGRGGAPSERSLGPCLAFGGLDLTSNWTLFWLLRMGSFRS